MLYTEVQIGEHHLVVVFVHENGIERLSFFATSCLHCRQSVVPENVWVICTIVLPTLRKFFRSNVEGEDTNFRTCVSILAYQQLIFFSARLKAMVWASLLGNWYQAAQSMKIPVRVPSLVPKQALRVFNSCFSACVIPVFNLCLLVGN